MADYLDREASESEGEEDEDTPRMPQSKRKPKAIESDDEEDEEDDDAGDLEDLIDDNPIEEDDEEDSDNESTNSRKRKKSDDDEGDDSELDEDDFGLIEENTGVKVKRRNRKRVKEIRDEDSDQEDAPDAAREQIARDIFAGGSDVEEAGDEMYETGQQRRAEDSEGEDSDEIGGFIVDDNDRPIPERAKRKTKRIYNDATLQEAQDIFGVEFDYDEFDKYDEDEEDEEADMDAYEDEEGERPAKKHTRKKRKEKSVYELYEPSELERAGLTEEDNKIRNEDIPERMQTRSVPVTPASEGEIQEEALWIYDLIFSKRRDKGGMEKSMASKSGSKTGDAWDDLWNETNKERQPEAEDDWDAGQSGSAARKPGYDDEDWDASSAVAGRPPPSSIGHSAINAHSAEEEHRQKYVPKISKTLDFIRNHYLEVPFITFYRKEAIYPDLNTDDVWDIYRADTKFCQLRTRKLRLLQLFKNIQDYQNAKIFGQLEDEINPSVRVVSETDYDRIKAIKTSEELKDIYLQFTLYYSDIVVPMKAWLQERRREERKNEKQAARAAANARAIDEGDEALKDVEDNPENQDDEDEEEQTTIKRKMGGGPYGLCRKMGLVGLTKLFGLTPEEFAENVRDSYMRNEVTQQNGSPLEVCAEYICPRLKTAEEVLRAAKFMVATQLSREPLLRQSVREIFFDMATINVHPTKKGMKEIDENHPIYTMKYLVDKPVRDLKDDEFLKLTIAEEDKLIVITIGDKIRAVSSDSNYVDEMKKLYILDQYSSHVEAWNAVRSECVEFALEKLLFPMLRKELRAKLSEEAKEWVLKQCSKKLFHKLEIAPYTVQLSPEEEDQLKVREGLQVIALAYVPDLSQAAFACHVGPDGEPSDYLRFQNIIKSRKAFRESDRQEKEADLTALKNFIRQKQPHVVVIGGESREALMLQEDVRSIIMDLSNEEEYPMISVEILENDLAKVYANSIKATNDFREYPLLLRQAISLARLIQDPLIEYSQLCTPDDEILCLRFHKLQDYVPKEELLERLLLEFVNRANEVGVDLNRALTCPYTANLVQFVCGLGIRKATALLKILKQANQRFENRTQLVTTCHMGPKVFVNCSGFIKIDTNSLGDSTDSYVEVLDGTRIHPETYEWARKMAVDALDYDDDNDPNPASALEEILESPEKLKDLDLDAFAEELLRNGFGEKHRCLYDIRKELNNRYQDFRKPYSSPTLTELFYMLTKETPETLHEGKLITCQVVGVSHKKPQGEQLDNAMPIKDDESGMWRCAFCGKNDFPDLAEVWHHFDAGGCPGQATGVRIRLDNGISGFIPIGRLSDKPVVNPDERVRRGQTIHCRILKVDAEKFSVDCTSRTSDLLDANHDYRPQKDNYYDFDAESRDKKKDEDLRKAKTKPTYVKRVIVHPSFKNISFKECEKIMEHVEPGEVIVRPSSKGSDHLTVTWKVANGVLQHIDVKEEGKENAFSLGHTLLIGKLEFEDLDEIIARHVNPMAGYCRDIINYKYYSSSFNGSREKAEEFLLEEKAKNANKIHYMLHPAKEFPGKFYLSYLPRHKVTHELISVTPEGFRYRQQYFDNLNQLLKWFKEHYRDPPPTVTPVLVTPRTANATRTPFETPHHAVDAMSRVGAPAPSQYGGAPSIVGTTPHFATPAQQPSFTPYSNYNNTPYTPTAQTPFLTPYAATPYQGQATPRFGMQGAGQSSASTIGASTAAADRRPRPAPRSVHAGGRPYNEADAWRSSAEAWAKASTKSAVPPAPPSSRFGGNPPPSTSSRVPPKSPAARNAAQVITDGINRTRQLTSSALNYIPNSPRSGRESLRSTPRTNFSPRSMVESSLGDGTPLYDEN